MPAQPNAQQQGEQSNTIFDVVIAGGGMTGATAAYGLAKLGLEIALIEAVKPSHESSPGFDQRAVALSASSVQIYRSLGLWAQLEKIACPIKQISVTDQGQFGFTRLDAADYQLDALGQVIALEQAGTILWKAVDALPNIHSFCPATVESIELFKSDPEANTCQVIVRSEVKSDLDSGWDSNSTGSQIITGKLLIAADGTYSKIAQSQNMVVSREPYHQHAIIANIQTELPHQNKAFERFTKSGPLALLPLKNNWMSLVWCCQPQQTEQAMAWGDEQFIQQLQIAFGFRLGKILKVSQRYQYPLSLHTAEVSHDSRLLLLGNAAHTLHPIGGQGFNLGLRDIAALIEQLETAMEALQDIGDQQFLADFIKSRQPDWQQTVCATDGLVRLFSNQHLPLVLLRNKAMNLINRLPLAKSLLAKSAMGFSGRSSRLARGLSIQPKRPLNRSMRQQNRSTRELNRSTRKLNQPMRKPNQPEQNP